MKLINLAKNCQRGVTLLEVTVVLVVLVTFIFIFWISAETYNRQARRAGCALVQDKIRKLVHTESNLTGDTLQPGVDYYIDPDYVHVYIEQDTNCPDGGTYTAILDASGNEIEINCTVHGNLLD